jgi:hypothetical protein
MSDPRSGRLNVLPATAVTGPDVGNTSLLAVTRSSVPATPVNDGADTQTDGGAGGAWAAASPTELAKTSRVAGNARIKRGRQRLRPRHTRAAPPRLRPPLPADRRPIRMEVHTRRPRPRPTTPRPTRRQSSLTPIRRRTSEPEHLVGLVGRASGRSTPRRTTSPGPRRESRSSIRWLSIDPVTAAFQARGGRLSALPLSSRKSKFAKCGSGLRRSALGSNGSSDPFRRKNSGAYQTSCSSHRPNRLDVIRQLEVDAHLSVHGCLVEQFDSLLAPRDPRGPHRD